MQRDSPTSGVLLSGHSGVGKTTWLCYMLIHLLADGKSVVFMFPDCIRRFYNNQVYTTIETRDLPGLTESISDVLWCRLIDSDCTAFSPDSTRYSAWIKQRSARILGLPLRNKKELEAGCVRLICLETPIPSKLIKIENSGISSVIWKPVDCTRSPSKLRVKKALEPLALNASNDHPEQRVDNLLRTLLRRAIEEHDYASRDVFSAIFCPGDMVIKTQNALAELSKDLLKVMRVSGVIAFTPAFNSPCQELVTISPIQSVYLELSDTFSVEFKSVAIRREIIKRLATAGQEKIRKVFDVHRGTMTSTVLSGWMVERMAHNIPRGIPSRVELFGALVPMCTEDGTPETTPCFCTTDPSRRPPQLTLRKREYAPVRFKNHKQRSVSASPWPQIILYSTSLLRLR